MEDRDKVSALEIISCIVVAVVLTAAAYLVAIVLFDWIG